jgi:DNA-binding CsgD family transcriptional regulator
MADVFVLIDNNIREILLDLEISCLRMTAEGHTPSEIGLALGIAEDRVLFHLITVQNKLKASNRLHAV